MSCRGVVMDEGHKVPFGRVWDLCHVSGIDEEFWAKKSLVLVVVLPLI